MSRWRALGGVVGPGAFIASWAILGTRPDGYSPIHDPISRLAAVHAETRLPMTVGLLSFAIGVGAYGYELRRVMPGLAGTAAIATAIGTVGIAVTPLDSVLGGTPHAAAAGAAYITLAATPVLAARPLVTAGHRRVAAASIACGLLTGGFLLVSVVAEARTGLWQRLGLSTGDVWLMASGLAMAMREPTSSRADS